MSDLDMRPKLAVDGPCPACGNGNFHREGCPVMPRDRELLHLRAEVKFKVEEIHTLLDQNAALLAERDRLKRALEEIANQDYRGNRSVESGIAYRALNPKETP